MAWKSKLAYEKVMEKHIKEAMANPMLSHTNDSLMLLDYVNKGDVEIDNLNGLITGKVS